MKSPPILVLDSVDSTNAEARRRAEAGEVGPLWIVARTQTSGRGRRGREWVSDAGNLAATLLTTTRRIPAEAAQVTFVAALAVAELAETFVPPSLVSIKWPNDVLVDGAKVSGILVESGLNGPGHHNEGLLWLAVGIGINLAHAPSGTERPATSLARHLAGEVADPPGVEAAIDILAGRFAAWQERWDTLGFGPVIDAWTARTHGLHGPCTARLGHETLSGTADGVDADGSLRLVLADGTIRRVSAGDVFFGDCG